MRKFLAHSTLAVFAAFCLWLPAVAQSQGNNSNSKNTAQSSNNQNQSSNRQAQARMQASRDAVRALRLTDQARQAIINKDQSRAKQEVEQALDLVNQAGDKLPATGNNSNTHVVPIFAELEQTSFLQPVLSAKKESSKGEQQQMASNQNSQSQESALPQSDQPPVVKRVEGGYSYIGLDLNAAKEHL